MPCHLTTTIFYLYVCAGNPTLIEQLRAMVIYNWPWNSPPAGFDTSCCYSHALSFLQIIVEAVVQSYDCSWTVGPETLLPHSLSALRTPQGMSGVRETRSGERAQRRWQE